ncbi:MAG: integrin alpha [Candidatus Thorarchaeota archaeon]
MRTSRFLFIIILLFLSFFQTTILQFQNSLSVSNGSVRAYAIHDDVRVVEYTGEFEEDWSGSDVTITGDVNNDGFDDFAISALFNDEGGANTGQTYLVFGRDTELWNADPSLADADASLIGEASGDWSGFEVSGIGNVNNDDYDDLAISAPLNDEGGDNAGQIYLFLGRETTEWSMDMSLSAADASFIATTGDTLTGISGAGDVNNDGYDDIVIGAPGNDEGGDNAGQVYLFLGRETTDWSMDMSLSAADASFIGEEPDDEVGINIEIVGDINNDDYDDIMIGAGGNDEGGSFAGQAYLIFGRATGEWHLDVDLSGVDASFIGENARDELGNSVSGAGDVNNDGYDDFIIGAIGNDEGGDTAGQIYLFLGRETTEWNMDMSLSAADASFIGEAAGDQAGWSGAGLGDTNGDNLDDFIITANRNDKGGVDAGRAYLFLGQTTEQWEMDTPISEANATFTGESQNDLFGSSVSGTGDVNKDGFNDFIIGAKWNGDSGVRAGKSYMVLYPFPVLILTQASSISLMPTLLSLGLISILLIFKRTRYQ